LNVTASPDFGIEELNDACNYIKERAHEDVNLIFGLVFDEAMKNSVRITVIATGIQGTRESINKIVTKIPSDIVGDEFEIPAFIRRRNIREGK